MFGFPINLQNNGVEKLTNDADNGFPKIQQREIFYSIKDGNWDDTSTWETASGRVGKLPTQSDDVYVRNIVTYITPAFANNVYVSNRLNGAIGGVALSVNNLYSIPNSVCAVGSGQLRINKNIYCHGLVSVGFGSIEYNGTNSDNTNFVAEFNPGFGGFTYGTNTDQNFIKGVSTYYNLTISGSGSKYLTSNTIVGNGITLNTPAFFECSIFDLQVNSTFIQNFGTTFSKSGGGNLLFLGQVQNYGMKWDLNGNPNVEFRAGLYLQNIGTTFYTGTGTWSFTTNNQDLTLNYTIETFDANILIGPGITLTMNSTAGAPSGGARLNATINGANGTSRLILGGGAFGGTQLFFNTMASVASMTTGIFDFTTFANTIHYSGDYTATIPSYFTTFHNLTITGTGTKSLGVNTTTNGNLLISNGNFSALTFNLQVGGTTNTTGVSNFTKTGAGSLLFIGSFQINPSYGNSAVVDFSGGNPSLEFRGGMGAAGGGSVFIMRLGTSTARFTTNNQNIDFSYCGSSPVFDGPVLIEGINLSLVGRASGRANYVFNNSIDGTNVSSTLTNQGWLRFNNILYTNPMSTNGTFVPSSGIYAYLDYAFNGNFSIPAFTTLNGLSIGGTGTKTLSANLTTNEIFIDGTLDLSSYNLVNNGNTTYAGGGGTIKKSGAGTILFVGAVSCAFDFSGGNPDVEFRNGFSYSAAPYITGTGQFKFSTNSQVFNAVYGGVVNLNCSVLISGAITLSIPAAGGGVSTFNFNNVINGDNAASKFLMNTNSPMTYNAATQPMATGILDTFTNANTWIYGNANQDIKGGPSTGAKQVYRNLTLNGGGTKTLQGYVSVLNTYTLTAPATLNNNGFTLTNP